MPQPSTPRHHATAHLPRKHREPPSYVQSFIDAPLEAAQSIRRRYQVPAGVVLAQSALESNWGRSVVGNAWFGVKGQAPSGASTTVTTHEVVNGKAITISDAFRAYGSFEEAAEDYAKMLRNNLGFRTCFLYTCSSQFAVAIARNGYATDPAYQAKLNAIIRAHNLDQYDNRRAER
ncbi:UNVERIFIED_ORG: flagellum-specific peptidoglycan hydrolase FlgJ [Burkholderia sp. CF145]